MHFGTTIANNFGVESMNDLVDFGVSAERLGYQSVWVSDHLFHAAYVAARLGDRPYHEPMTVLTAIAARTHTVELGTSVLVLPWHHPVRLAKTVASLDNLSNGRVIVGVGVGSTEDEYQALGVPFDRRGQIANEYLAAMRALWTEQVPAYHGEHLSFEGLRFEPKPVQTPHPPIWVGGSSPAAIRRLLRFGQGWHPLRLSPADLASSMPRLRDSLAAAGRPIDMPVAVRLVLSFAEPASTQPVSERKTCKGSVEEMAALITAYANAGVSHIMVDGATPDLERASADLQRFAEEVIPLID